MCGEDINCDVTYDRDKFDEAGAVIFHFLETHQLSKIPNRRFDSQLYTWWCRETISTSNLNSFDNVFNLTMTYRRDSDIYGPYATIPVLLNQIKTSGDVRSISELISQKSNDRMAIWFVSNCRCHKRIELSQQLVDNGIHVERYGHCFNRKGVGRDEMVKEISKYKFYLSFENAHHCKDYITEKLWKNGFLSGTVPVYWGARKEEVEDVVPKHSVIYVDDFKTIKDLANYLKYLSQNDTAYAEYFKWRKWLQNPTLIEDRLREDHIDNEGRGFCRMCRLLHERRLQTLSGETPKPLNVESLKSFWHKGEHSECIDNAKWR